MTISNILVGGYHHHHHRPRERERELEGERCSFAISSYKKGHTHTGFGLFWFEFFSEQTRWERDARARLSRTGRQVHPEEDVELDEGGEYEEDGVHAEAGAADLAVELEAIRGEGDVKEQQSRQQRYRAVLQAT